jgi:outer membrane protein
MKFRLFLFVVLLSCSFTLKAASKIGFVNITGVIAKSPQAAKANKRLEKKFLSRKNKLEKEVKKFKKEIEKLKKNSLTMSKEKKSSEEARLKKVELKLKRDEKAFTDDLNIQRNEEFKKIRDDIFKVIKAYAKKHKYNAILAEGSVLFADEKTNISDNILNELKKLK